MKKLICLILVYTVLCSTAFALDYNGAVGYANIINELDARGTRNKYYLADFDADGNEELFAICNYNSEYFNFYATYEVYSGNKLVGSEMLAEDNIVISRNTEDNKLYLRKFVDAGGAAAGFEAYTIVNGEWKMTADYGAAYASGVSNEKSYKIDGQPVSKEEYEAKEAVFIDCIDLNKEGTAMQELSNIILSNQGGYGDDVYSKLSDEERELLFDDFLYDIAYVAKEINTKEISDEDLVNILVDLLIDTDYSEIENEISKRDFDEYTMKRFGRIVDYSKFQINHQPTFEDYGYNTVYYNGMYTLCYPQRGSDIGWCENMGKSAKLYKLADNKYYTSFMLENKDEYFEFSGVFGAILTKNDDGSYCLQSLGSPLSAEELTDIINPSSWAEAEISKATEAQLVPQLKGDPFWKDEITRFQFAQLAVNMAEKAIGKKLTASHDVFTDCNDEAVLKAYKAGIINGVSETKFAPYNKLTREQLATMLWRTIKYIQTETNNEKLTSDGNITAYTDRESISDYAKEAVTALAKNNIMKGTSETELSPHAGCSVEQSVILIYRTFNKIK